MRFNIARRKPRVKPGPSDPRYSHNGTVYTGFDPHAKAIAARERQETLAKSHPLTHGWTVSHHNTEYDLTVYSLAHFKLMKHPPCRWLDSRGHHHRPADSLYRLNGLYHRRCKNINPPHHPHHRQRQVPGRYGGSPMNTFNQERLILLMKDKPEKNLRTEFEYWWQILRRRVSEEFSFSNALNLVNRQMVKSGWRKWRRANGLEVSA